MEATNGGTTVTVGSVHELANILANMPPEQLQNVQLDPILYNALFQTIDTNAQPLDTTCNGSTENPNIQPPAIQGKTNEEIILQPDPFQMLNPTLQQMNEHDVTDSSRQLNHNAHISSTLKITKPSLESQIQTQVNEIGKTSHTYGNSSSVTSSVMTSHENIGLSQPHGADLNKTVNAHTNDVDFQDILSGLVPGLVPGVVPGVVSGVVPGVVPGIIPGTAPGILQGQPSSALVTVTVTSQVIPTPAVQMTKPVVVLPGVVPGAVPGTTPSRYPQVVTLPSNAPLQPSTMSTVKVNGSTSKVTSTDRNITPMHRVSREKVVDTKSGKAGGNSSHMLSERKSNINKSVISSNDISSQLSFTVCTNANSLFSSIPVVSQEKILLPEAISTTSHDMLGHASLQISDSVSIENAAIVLTNEQLAELMSGKSVEEVLQVTQNRRNTQHEAVQINSLEMFNGFPPITESATIDPQIPPLREIQMIQKAPIDNNELTHSNVIKPKPVHGKYDAAYLPAKKQLMSAVKDNLSASKNILPVNKNTLPINKNTLPVNKNIMPVGKNVLHVNKEVRDHKKNQVSKQITELGDMKKNFSNTLKTGLLRTPTSLSSVHKETKSAFSSYNKASSLHHSSSHHASSHYTDAQRAFTGLRLHAENEAMRGDNKAMRHNEAMQQGSTSGTTVNQNIVIQGKNVWPVNRGKNISKDKNICMSERERLQQYQHNTFVPGNKGNPASPANVVKSAISSAALCNAVNKTHKDLKSIGNVAKSHVDKDNKFMGGNRVINSGVKSSVEKGCENTGKQHAQDVDHEKKLLDASGKATFNRSFKKMSHCSGESKKRIKKTLKEMEKTYPKEVSEILNIREAIKSSHVGDGENAMRKLAKLEIENQLKRFSQKVNMGRNAEFFSKERKLDIRRRKNIDLSKTNHDKSNRTNKTDVLNESDMNKKEETKDDDTKEQGRKRERPKKFDDFVLGSKPKKDKKVRKFFFPEDFEENLLQKKEEDAEMVLNEEVASCVAEGKATEASGNVRMEGKGKENIIDDTTITGNVDITKSDDKAPLSVDKDKLSSMFDMKSITPEIKIERLSLEKKDIEPAPKKKCRDLEERSFLDAISGDITPVSETTMTQPFPDVKEEEDDDEDGDEEGDDEEEEGKIVDEETAGDSDHCTAKDVKEILESLDISDNDASKPKTKTKSRKKKKKKKSMVMYEPQVLPEHLKRKTKLVKVEETVIDLSRVQMKSAYSEASFDLSDSIDYETSQLLRRKDWVCNLCGKPGNIGTLDVLFGPYNVHISNYVDSNNSTFSTWVHRDCVIWTSTIYLNNQKLCGLGEALTSGAKMTCQLCTKVGATLECSFRQCRDNYHFVCAKQRGCSFKMENFTITCPKHR